MAAGLSTPTELYGVLDTRQHTAMSVIWRLVPEIVNGTGISNNLGICRVEL